MYWTIISSFFIQQLRPGHFSWIHGLSVFTFVTLSMGLCGPDAPCATAPHLHDRLVLWTARRVRGRGRRAEGRAYQSAVTPVPGLEGVALTTLAHPDLRPVERYEAG